MPPAKLQLAKKQITAFFDAAEKRVFSRRGLSTVLAQNRNNWQLAQGTTANDFIEFLCQKAELREDNLKSEKYVLPPRYIWGQVSPYLLALSIRKAGYL